MEDIIYSVITSAVVGSAVVWILRSWLTERLRQSISYEYSQKLESYKTELNSKVESIRHENSITQIRTSLFFDHQREAFSGIISLIIRVNRAWIDDSYVDYHGPDKAVPSKNYHELKDYYEKSQLFLDEECVLSMDLVMSYYSDSFPFDDGSGELHDRDSATAYDNIETLLPVLAGLFRRKIGVVDGGESHKLLLLIGALRLVNSMSFYGSNIPPKGILRVKPSGPVGKMIQVARDNELELLEYLSYFNGQLKLQGGFQERYRESEVYLRLLGAK